MRPSPRAAAQQSPALPVDGLPGAKPPPVAPAHPAPHVVTLQASDFNDMWPSKPLEGGARIGIRLVGEDTIEKAERMALDDVALHYAGKDVPPDLLEVRGAVMLDQYNNEFVTHVLAHALCKPDNARSHFFEKAPDACVAAAFHPGTIQMLWNEYMILRQLLSPLGRLATDEELAALMPDPSRATNRLRRLVALAHDELESVLDQTTE